MNRKVFDTIPKAPADTVNEAGGRAYKLDAKEALARFACVGTFGDTFYVRAEDQLSQFMQHAEQTDSEFLGRLAIYSRRSAFMKDTPATLLAILAARSGQGDLVAREWLRRAFPIVVNNGKMLRNFVTVIRSGVTGRRSFGTGVRHLIANRLNSWTPAQLLKASVGKPTLGDVIRMVHPAPQSQNYARMFRYLVTGDVNSVAESLSTMPEPWHSYLTGHEHDDIPWEMMTAKGPKEGEAEVDFWKYISTKMGWHALRMNINTLQRHGCFEGGSGKIFAGNVAARLRDPNEIRRSMVFPYQIFVAYEHIEPNTPRPIINALHDAMEIAVENTPKIAGNVAIIVDTSGSMGSPVTGRQAGTPASKVSCVQAAALMAVCLARQADDFQLIPVDTRVHQLRFEPRDSILTLAGLLSKLGGGGTAISVGLDAVKGRPDVIVILSDNESWADTYTNRGWGRGPEATRLEAIRQSRFRGVPLVTIDMQPVGTAQVKAQPRMHVAGFSDSVFHAIIGYLSSEKTSWMKKIEQETDQILSGGPSMREKSRV